MIHLPRFQKSRREKQKAFNEKYGITPKGVVKPIVDILETDLSASDIEEIGSDNIQVKLSPVQLSKELKRLEKEMYKTCVSVCWRA